MTERSSIQRSILSIAGAILLATVSQSRLCAAQDDLVAATVEVRRKEAIVSVSPSETAARRGVVEKGARFAVLAALSGPGCLGYWLQIHTDAWICSSEVVRVEGAPQARALPVLREGQVTPWPYAFVREPTIEYKLSLGFLQEQRDLLPGFGFAFEGVVTHEGVRYLKTAENTLIPADAAGKTSRISQFEGVEIPAASSSSEVVGFVNSRKAWVYDKPRPNKAAKLEALPRYSIVRVTEQIAAGKKTFSRIGENRFVDRAELRLMRPAARPASLFPGEKWIDVDVDQQLLTAYEGEHPVFVTMVSSGRRGPSATAKGEYRIWVKVAAIAMDNTDENLEQGYIYDAEAEISMEEQRLYSLRHVPWTQFFFESYALHGVYWHDRFGNRRSHGCVNLSPKDAKRLYDWTSPSVPEGFWSIHSTESDKGTLVRIR
ncbi:MAG: L,D-transpeptidase [Myxococcota bacterium]|nr:L,D-transpeptidase [Myxococcota bacterium]